MSERPISAFGKRPVSEAFDLIAQVVIKLGAAPLNRHEGCFEFALDEMWRISINGHLTPHKVSGGAEVPPGNAYLECNGWPAGFIDPFGGMIVGGANSEDELIAALSLRLEQLNGGAP
jgi:hypothetical protein